MAANPKLPKLPTGPNLARGAGGGSHRKAAVAGGALFAGTMALPLVDKTQGYADLSKILGDKKKAAFADLRPARSALVRAKTGAMAPIKAEGQKLQGALSQTKVAVQKSGPVSELNKERGAAKSQLGAAKSSIKRDVAGRVAPARSALVQSPAVKEARAGKAQLNTLVSQAKGQVRGDLGRAKSVGSQAKAAAQRSEVGQDVTKIKGLASAERSAIKGQFMKGRAAALKRAAPAKSALVADKSKLNQLLAPGRSAISRELGDAKKIAGATKQGVSKGAGNLGKGAVGQLKKRPRIWNIVKPAGSQ
jgi:hypothetical protein